MSYLSRIFSSQYILNRSFYSNLGYETISALKKEEKTNLVSSWPVRKEILNLVEIQWPIIQRKNIFYDVYFAAFEKEFKKSVKLTYSEINQPKFPECLFFRIKYKDIWLKILLDHEHFAVQNCERVGDYDLCFKFHFRKDYSDDKTFSAGFITWRNFIYKTLTPLRNLAKVEKKSDIFYAGNLWSQNLWLRNLAFKQIKGLSPEIFTYRKYSPFTYLKKLSQSQTQLEIFGWGHNCYKFIEGMALGIPTFKLKSPQEFHVEVLPGRDYIEIEIEDILSGNIKNVIEETLNDKELMKNISQNNIQMFDQYFHKKQLVSYYIHKILTKGFKLEL